MVECYLEETPCWENHIVVQLITKEFHFEHPLSSVEKSLYWFMTLTNNVNLAIYYIHLLFKQLLYEQQINMLRHFIKICFRGKSVDSLYCCFYFKNHFGILWQVFLYNIVFKNLIFQADVLLFLLTFHSTI